MVAHLFGIDSSNFPRRGLLFWFTIGSFVMAFCTACSYWAVASKLSDVSAFVFAYVWLSFLLLAAPCLGYLMLRGPSSFFFGLYQGFYLCIVNVVFIQAIVLTQSVDVGSAFGAACAFSFLTTFAMAAELGFSWWSRNMILGEDDSPNAPTSGRPSSIPSSSIGAPPVSGAPVERPYDDPYASQVSRPVKVPVSAAYDPENATQI